jgi:hypothetical protein
MKTYFCSCRRGSYKKHKPMKKNSVCKFKDKQLVAHYSFRFQTILIK